MADVKISELTAQASANVDISADVLALVDTSATQTKKISVENLLSPITIDKSAGTITSLGTVTGNVDFNADLDVDGVTNLDVVDIDGAVDMASTLTVSGSTGSDYIGSFTNTSATGWGLFVKGGADNADYSLRVQDKDANDLLSVKSGGNIGVGTNDPNQTLHIKGASNTGGIRLANTGVSYYNEIRNNGDGLLLDIDKGDAGGAGADLRINISDSEKIRILNDGKVGINTANPIRPLSVSYGVAKTDTNTAYAMSIQSNESSGQAALQFYAVGGASAAVRKWQLQTTEVGVANAGIIEFQPDGGVVSFANSVGIGTTNPVGTLNISKSSDPSLYITDSTASRNLFFTIGSSISVIGNEQSFPLAFRTNNTERMRIDGAGNTTIGTFSMTNPDTTYRQFNVGGFGVLHREAYDTYVTSNAYYNTSGQYIAKYAHSDGIGLMQMLGGVFTFNSYSGSVSAGSPYTVSEKLRISSDGRLGIGINNPNAKLDIKETSNGQELIHLNHTVTGANQTFLAFKHDGTVRGTIIVNDSTDQVVYNTTSDERVKENIEKVNDALSIVNKIPVKQFNFIGNEQKTPVIGYIGQELIKEYPQAVTITKTNDFDDYHMVDESKMVAVLMKAVQELSAKVEALENA